MDMSLYSEYDIILDTICHGIKIVNELHEFLAVVKAHRAAAGSNKRNFKKIFNAHAAVAQARFTVSSGDQMAIRVSYLHDSEVMPAFLDWRNLKLVILPTRHIETLTFDKLFRMKAL